MYVNVRACAFVIRTCGLLLRREALVRLPLLLFPTKLVNVISWVKVQVKVRAARRVSFSSSSCCSSASCAACSAASECSSSALFASWASLAFDSRCFLESQLVIKNAMKITAFELYFSGFNDGRVRVRSGVEIVHFGLKFLHLALLFLRQAHHPLLLLLQRLFQMRLQLKLGLW